MREFFFSRYGDNAGLHEKQTHKHTHIYTHAQARTQLIMVVESELRENQASTKKIIAITEVSLVGDGTWVSGRG